MVALAVAVGGVAEFSPLFSVRSIKVLGTRQVDQQQILDAASIDQRTPLLRLNRSAITNRIKAILPVRSVSVSTSLPSTVVITVTERVPIAYRAENNYYRVLDVDGVAFRAMHNQPQTVPRIDAPAGSPQAAAALRVAAALPAGILKSTAAISAATAESVTLTLADGRVIFWGGTDRNADKGKLLPVLLGQPGRYFDLSDPDAVISRPTA